MKMHTLIGVWVLLALLRPFAVARAMTDEPADDHAVSPRDGFSSAVAYAVPLDKIKIDGSLDDWPKDAIRYPIVNNFQVYGPTHGDTDNLVDSADLTAYFMVGYNAEAGQVYLAVVVRDDQNVVGHKSDATDAVEAYLQSQRGAIQSDDGQEQSLADDIAAVSNPVAQYVIVPGEGSYNTSPAPGENPSFNAGGFEATGSKIVFKRDRGVTVYEMALTCFDQNPGVNGGVGVRTELKPGKRLGFDVVAVDKDDPPASRPKWVCWGPSIGGKFSDGARLGELVLLRDASELGAISGAAVDGRTGKPWPGLIVEARRDEQDAGYAIADAHGHYELRLPSGGYEIKPARLQGAATTRPSRADVRAAATTTHDLRVAPLDLPPALERAIAVYSSLLTYQDRTVLRLIESDDKAAVLAALPMMMTAGRRAGARFTSVSSNEAVVSVVCDGARMAVESDDPSLAQPVTPARHLVSVGAMSCFLDAIARANPAVNATPVRQLLMGGAFPHRLVLNADPRREVLRGLDAATVIGHTQIDSKAATVVQLVKQHHAALPASPPITGGGSTTQLRLWITDGDGLIRRTQMRVNFWKVVSEVERIDIFPNLESEHSDIRIDQPIPPGSVTPPRSPIGEQTR